MVAVLGCRSSEGGRQEGLAPCGSECPESFIEPELTQELTAAVGRAHARVRFRAPLSLDQHRDLSLRGLRLVAHLGDGSYVVSFPTPIDLGHEPYATLVVSARRVRPGEKLHPLLLRAFEGADAKDRRPARVVFFADVEREPAEAELRRLGIPGRKVGVGPVFRVELLRAQLAILSASRLVACVQPVPAQPEPLNDQARALVHADLAQDMQTVGAGAPTYDGRSGKGIRIGVCDFGVDEGHHDLFDPVSWTTRVEPSSPDGLDSDHGTFVAGIAAGNGWNTPTAQWPAFGLRGQAPEASLAEYPPFSDDVPSYHDAFVNDGTHVTNHSMPQGTGPQYMNLQAGIDAIVLGGLVDGWPIDPAPMVWAAGNYGVDPGTVGVYEGWYSVLAPAKNSICVGSVDTDDGQLSEYSSLGPTLDGRLKPDLVAPGTHRTRGASDDGLIAANGGTQSYGTRPSGTSFAAPVVTGIIALMMEAAVDELGATPHGLRAATYKAVLVQTARDRARMALDGTLEPNPDTGEPVTYPPGPDFATGFGMVDAQAAVELVEDPARWEEATLAADGDEHVYCMTVEPQAELVRVALAWDDLPGACFDTPTGPKLVDDLDLHLVDPAGGVHRPYAPAPLDLADDPWSGDPDPISTAEVVAAPLGADHLNNVELAEVPAPLPGLWKVHVRAFSLPMGTTRPYSLAASHPLASPCFELPPAEFPVCQLLPWICEALSDRWPRLTHGRARLWEGAQVLPLSKVLENGAPGPARVQPGWMAPPELSLELDGLPPDAQVLVFDERGRVLARSRERGATRSVAVRAESAATRPYLALAQASGAPLRGAVPVRIRIHRSP
jgi:hypothetical protein